MNEKIRIRVTGQLPEKTNPTILLVTSNAVIAIKTVEEYLNVFPEIQIIAEWGYFKIPVDPYKAQALARLLSALL